jgi:Protein of unknown function (DUF3611)
MFNFLSSEAVSSTPQQLARSFRWLGWVGFWLQALLGFIPLLVVVARSNMIAIQAMIHAIAAGLVGAAVALVLLYQVGNIADQTSNVSFASV